MATRLQRLSGEHPIAPSTNLAPERTTFLGRARDLAAIEAHFARGARLVTVYGAGGVGKTRLAHRLATRWLERRGAGGAWLCELADARGREDLVAAVARALGTPLGASERPEGARDQVGLALAARGPSLFVLDNFEQLVGHAAETVGRWLAQAPQAHVLVTSREPLGLAGEVRYELLPLGDQDAAALFEERASLAAGRAVVPEGVTDARSTVEAIVRRLDGLPLAIELAAARADLLSPAQILERLDQRLDLLRDVRRDVAPRHATLRATLEWSWELLDASERAALAQCAVFRGGFTADAAEEVLQLEAPGAPAALDVVHALRRKSLVRAADAPGGGPMRLSLLETVRAFGSERLSLLGGALEARGRHARYYVAAAERWAAQVDGPGGVAAAARLGEELDNVLAAHAFALADAPALAARAAVSLAPLLQVGFALRLGVALFDDAVHAARRSQDPTLLARTLATRGEARFLAGAFEGAQLDLREGAELAARHGAAGAEVDCLYGLNKLDRLAARVAEAGAHLARALAVARAAGDRAREGLVLGGLGVIAQYEGRFDEARGWHERALAMHHAAGNRWAEGAELGVLAMLLGKEGRAREAVASFERAAAVHAETGNRVARGIALKNLGEALGELGRSEVAMAHLEAACALFREAGVRWREGMALCLVGQLHTEAGRHADALTCLERALAVQRELGTRFAESLALALLGQLLADMGQWRGALECCERALVASGGANAEAEVVALACLAVGRGAQGDAAGARASLERARERVALEPRLAPMLAVAHACVEVEAAREDSAGAARARVAAERTRAELTRGDDAPASRSVHTRLALRLLERALAAAPQALEVAQAPARVRVGAGCERVTAPDGRVLDLRRRRPLRLVLECLVARRLEAPGQPVAWDALLAAGWPGQRAIGQSGFGRVRTAVWTLRKLGLGDVLQTREDGYVLDPAVPVERAG